MNVNDLKIAVIGLGYVGLPLAVEFGKKRKVIAFDIDKDRIKDLKNLKDVTLETSTEDLRKAKKIYFTSNTKDLADSNCYIIAVPTPIDKFKKPKLSPLINATKLVGKVLKKDDVVIYESTVYPGATEEDCVPVLEKFSKLKFNKDFYCGYSPERINPGDKQRKLKNIIKVTSGSNDHITNLIDDLYKTIIIAGTHKAPNIKTAEAAKIIENTQRDLNVALINELSIIFNKMGIDTEEVLKAASTKWNFLNFTPGLVGGHCIGVDPYYLTYKSKKFGYNPRVILAGRKVNDNMGKYVASQTLKTMVKKSININKAKILILGLTFKENCSDIRNTRVVDIIEHLQDYGCIVHVYDPWVNKNTIEKNDFNVSVINSPKINNYDGIILAVGHDIFKKMGMEKIKSFGKKIHVLYDLKHILSANDVDLRL